MAALGDVDLQYIHILGENSRAVKLLSYRESTLENAQELNTLVENSVWAPVNIGYMDIVFC